MTPIVVVHGANGSGSEVWPLAHALLQHAPVYVPDLLGHGGRPHFGALSIEALADDLVAQVQARGFGPSVLVGYSVGGLVALRAALRHPTKVRGVVALATKHIMDGPTIDRWQYLLRPERLGHPDNPRGRVLEKIHFPRDWKAVAQANHAMFEAMRQKAPITDEELAAIRVPALVLSGDQDQIVPLAETRRLAQLVRSPTALFKGPAHPMKVVPLGPVSQAIAKWVAELPKGS